MCKAPPDYHGWTMTDAPERNKSESVLLPLGVLQEQLAIGRLQEPVLEYVAELVHMRFAVRLDNCHSAAATVIEDELGLGNALEMQALVREQVSDEETAPDQINGHDTVVSHL